MLEHDTDYGPAFSGSHSKTEERRPSTESTLSAQADSVHSVSTKSSSSATSSKSSSGGPVQSSTHRTKRFLPSVLANSLTSTSLSAKASQSQPARETGTTQDQRNSLPSRHSHTSSSSSVSSSATLSSQPQILTTPATTTTATAVHIALHPPKGIDVDDQDLGTPSRTLLAPGTKSHVELPKHVLRAMI